MADINNVYGNNGSSNLPTLQCNFAVTIITNKMNTTKLTQKQAHEILVRNNHFCGGNIPFDKTTNYIGMLCETNTHRRIWNAKELI